MRFIIIIVMYNMEDWIAENIRVLQKQTYKNFRCFIGDDISTDNSVKIAQDTIGDDTRFEVIPHANKKYSLGNICTLLQHAKPEKDDVIILIDGDDRLANEQVLEKLKTIYEEKLCWMTYGSYVDQNGNPEGICQPYSKKVIQKNAFRKARWRASHLKTFRYFLWQKIEPWALTITEIEFRQAKQRALIRGKLKTWLRWRKIQRLELLDPNGIYPKRCGDKGLTIPMLEIAGPKAHFVPDILYVYNTYDKDLGYNAKLDEQRWYTRCIRDIIRHKPAHQRITNLDQVG